MIRFISSLILQFVQYLYNPLGILNVISAPALCSSIPNISLGMTEGNIKGIDIMSRN